MAVTVSELFKDYERDLERALASVSEKLEAATDNGNGALVDATQISQLLSQVEKHAGEADQALKQMEMESRTLPTHQRSEIDPRLRKYRSEIRESRRKVQSARDENERRSLLGRGDGDTGTVIGKSRAFAANQKLDAATARLQEAHKQALESEQIGVEVMSDLRHQRDVIKNARNNMSTIGSNLGTAKDRLQSMARRAAANKIIVYVVVVFFLIMLGVVGYMFTHPRS
jgi:vesicle transport through interaction with t-SNAREs protein 1